MAYPRPYFCGDVVQYDYMLKHDTSWHILMMTLKDNRSINLDLLRLWKILFLILYLMLLVICQP